MGWDEANVEGTVAIKRHLRRGPLAYVGLFIVTLVGLGVYVDSRPPPPETLSQITTLTGNHAWEFNFIDRRLTQLSRGLENDTSIEDALSDLRKVLTWAVCDCDWQPPTQTHRLGRLAFELDERLRAIVETDDPIRLAALIPPAREALSAARDELRRVRCSAGLCDAADTDTGDATAARTVAWPKLAEWITRHA